MDEYESLRQAGTITDPPPEVFARAQQILLDCIAADTTSVVPRSTFEGQAEQMAQALPRERNAEANLSEAHLPALPHRRSKKSGRMPRWSVGVAAAVVVCAVLILQVLPTSKTATSMAAAEQISQLADSVQPSPPLQAGQWSTYQMQGTLSADVGSVGGTPTPNAQASIPVAFEVWSNSTDATCTSQQLGAASFASPVNAQAWGAIGLIDTPAHQPATGCAGGVETSDGAQSALSAIYVSNLTHDPATLAEQLQNGTTGISTIDQAAMGDPANVAGFVRLTVLLVSPISGGWPGFDQEMLQTMALLPGVVSLGPTTSHSGKTGIGFSTGQQVTLNPQTGAVASKWSGPTVVLDAQTGALLEARNFDIPVLQSAAQDFVGSSSAPVDGGATYGVTTEWIDPVAPPSVVGQGALPTWINTFHILEAVAKATTTSPQVSTVVTPFIGGKAFIAGDFIASDDNVPSPGQTTYDITIVGTAADGDSAVAALTASGLFASVTVVM